MEHIGVSAHVVIESCPACGSVDVCTLEPRWFRVEVDRRDELHDAAHAARHDDCLAVEVRFACRGCGISWD